ncbi:unnamed protein product [Ceutorhynchus assimilis]|uniref:Uncharacterized protein n=1 Tax=Ceutorhynchus assimilis TaxID=467358 RepID=A0A9N9ME54_9CUCU|nr:unnamed protein product [Ceutorhynchus assimilis]
MSNNIKINQNYVNVSPMQLFDRIICSNKTPDEIRDSFSSELSPYPLSLFKDGILRQGTKSLLFKEFDALLATPISSTEQNAIYIVDGGFLLQVLHKVLWQKPTTFHQICDKYINYAKHNYGQDCVVVFDGYNLNRFSTKDALQQVRSQNAIEISEKLENSIVTPQEEF